MNRSQAIVRDLSEGISPEVVLDALQHAKHLLVRIDPRKIVGTITPDMQEFIDAKLPLVVIGYLDPTPEVPMGSVIVMKLLDWERPGPSMVINPSWLVMAPKKERRQ